MLILMDNDVVGAVRAFRRILESEEWAESTSILDLQFIEFPDVELPRDVSDVTVWQRCQEVGALLVTGNRSSDTLILALMPPGAPPENARKSGWQKLGTS